MVRFPDEVWSEIVRMSLDLDRRGFWMNLHKHARSWPLREAQPLGNRPRLWPAAPAHAIDQPLDVLSSIRFRSLVLDWEENPSPSTSHHNRGVAGNGRHQVVSIIIYPHQISVHTDSVSRAWTARFLDLDPDFIREPDPVSAAVGREPPGNGRA